MFTKKTLHIIETIKDTYEIITTSTIFIIDLISIS